MARKCGDCVIFEYPPKKFLKEDGIKEVHFGFCHDCGEFVSSDDDPDEWGCELWQQ